MEFAKLEEELNGLVEAEDLYWLRNDAKFRAAKQNVSYEEFEQIVKCSHLTPLGKSDRLQIKHKTIWNAHAAPEKTSGHVMNSSLTAKPEGEPKANQSRKYGGCKSSNPSASLHALERQMKLMKAKGHPVDQTFIITSIETLDKSLEECEKNAEQAVRTWDLLASMKRFDLEWTFISGPEQFKGQKLAEKLENLKKHA